MTRTNVIVDSAMFSSAMAITLAVLFTCCMSANWNARIATAEHVTFSSPADGEQLPDDKTHPVDEFNDVIHIRRHSPFNVPDKTLPALEKYDHRATDFLTTAFELFESKSENPVDVEETDKLFEPSPTVRIVRHVSGDAILEEPKNHLELETRKISDSLKSANEIGKQARNYYNDIRPTKTTNDPRDDSHSSGPDSSIFNNLEHWSGEGKRAPSYGRSLSMAEPNSAKLDFPAIVQSIDKSNSSSLESASSSASQFFSSSSNGSISNGTIIAGTGTRDDESARSDTSKFARKNPNGEIQEIINGFVKLLNGNVAVQVNTDLPPPATRNMPASIRTRINNRGPPRISDVPPLIFDSPYQPPPLPSSTSPAPQQSLPTKATHPYPFDGPHSLPPQPSNIVVRPYFTGIPLPELIVPADHRNSIKTNASTVEDNPSLIVTSAPVQQTSFVLLTTNKTHSNDKSSYSNKTFMEKSPMANKINNPSNNNNKTSVDKVAAMTDKSKWKEETSSGKFGANTAVATTPTSPILTNATTTNAVIDNNIFTKAETDTHANKSTNVIKSSNVSNINKNVDKVSDNVLQSSTVNNQSIRITPTLVSNINATSSLPGTVNQSSTIVRHQSDSPAAVVTSTSLKLPIVSASISNVNALGSIAGNDSHQPTTGIGTAVVVLEPSTQEVPSHQDTHKVTAIPNNIVSSTSLKRRPPPTSTSSHQHHQYNDGNAYFPRPGIVLDDLEYKPGGFSNGNNPYRRPTHPSTAPGIITAAQNNKDIFDITVSAIQGPGSVGNDSKLGQPYVYPVDIETGLPPNNNLDPSIITSADSTGQNFVSIDGKRTYLNLFENNVVTTSHGVASVQPTHVKNHGLQSGGSSTLAHNNIQGFGGHHPASTPAAIFGNKSDGSSSSNSGNVVVAGKPPPSSTSPAWKKPAHPAVRIDTCIVGDDSTCDAAQHEICRTEGGVSSCHCRPSYNRRKHREPCHRVVSLFLTLRVDRMYDQHLTWNDKYTESDSNEFQQLEYEAAKAIDSALSMTPFSDLFLGARVNNIYTSRNGNSSPPVFVNMTVQLSESAETLRTPVKQDLQKHLMGVIHRRSNNIGSSPLWVDTPNGAISQIHDVDECTSAELNDCHSSAKCTNIFGSFYCICPEGFRDPWAGNNHRSGRICEKCDPSNCNHRGECSFQNGQPICKCTGSYYGSQCEVDGEILGVAIGSSVIAVLIIVTTLACLCAWSRRWNKEQKIGSPIFGYMPTGGSAVKTPVVGAPPYQVSLEDRLRWAQIADAMAHANHYGPEPVGTLRPSSSIFGYSLPHSNGGGALVMPRLRAPSVHTLRTPESSTTSEEEDRADLLGRQFQVPRPKSRSSVANQSGIYYDVDYESQQQNGEIFSTMKSGQPPCIPLNTYTMGSRSHYYRS